MQGILYMKGKYGEPGMQPFDMTKPLMNTRIMLYLMVKLGALTGDKSFNG